MIRAVLDTNTLVSAVINIKSSLSSEIYQKAKDRYFLLILSPLILAEIIDVLHRDRIMKSHKRSHEELKEVLKELTDVSFKVPGDTEVKIVRDPDDNKIISAALEGKAHYIVSRDKDLLDLKEHSGVIIISPEQFIKILRAQV